VPPPIPVLGPDGLLAAPLLAAAEARIRGALAPTPALWSAGHGAFLKLESLQVTGAYKVRGAYNAIAAQVERGDRRPVVAASAGNHGLGVAWAARALGLAAIVVVPREAPATKVRGCRALGAEVLVGGEGFEDCAAAARALAVARGGRFLHAFDEAEVVAGQATVGAELAALAPDVVVVPVGGGGLAAGIASALRPRGVRVVGAQVAGVDALRRALRGAPPLAAPGPTIADGLRVALPGALTTRICAAGLDDVVTVEEEEVAEAIARLALEDKIVAEGAGAVAVAALVKVRGARRVAVVSGGNIDAALLGRLTSARAA
jgi:threonine dehydratase